MIKGSHILGSYVREQQQRGRSQGPVQPMAVDLSNGKYKSSRERSVLTTSQMTIQASKRLTMETEKFAMGELRMPC